MHFTFLEQNQSVVGHRLYAKSGKKMRCFSRNHFACKRMIGGVDGEFFSFGQQKRKSRVSVH